MRGGMVKKLGPALRPLATPSPTTAGILVLGKSPRAMAEALARLRRLGGGITLCSAAGKWSEFPFSMAGVHRSGGFAEAAQAAREFQGALAACGYPHADARYTLLFLTGDILPELRATEAGWVRVKTDEVLFPSELLIDD